MLSGRDDRTRSDASDGVWFALRLIDDLKEAPTMRLMIAIVLTLIIATTPGFAGQERGQGDPDKGALVGGIVGLGAGFAASAIYSHTTQQCDSEAYQNTLARCGLPIAGMVIGGAFAGHFIGRLADKPSREKPSRTAAGQGWRPLTVPAPKVTLRQPTSSP
jgi:hypothetical protein